MDTLLSELQKIRADIEIMKSDIQEIKKGTSKMETHIGFVESVYSQIKSPFHYIMESIVPIAKITCKIKTVDNTKE
jgi:prefoldin subunit 5